MQNSNRIFYLFIPTLVLIFLFLCIAGYVGLFEDAFISFRYAANLAAGRGLVFNVGEHVWGYSNFLWTVLLALGVSCGFSIAAFAKYMGVLAGCIIITALFYWLLRRGSHDNFFLALTGPVFLATSTHFMIASQNGLETVFFTLLFFLGVLFFLDEISYQKGFPWYAICFLLASMTRPEGPLFMVVAGFIELTIFIYLRKKLILQRLGLSVLIFTVGYFFYILFMYLYYDALLPNAFFVKVDLSSSNQIVRGISYLRSFLTDIRALFLLWPLIFIFTDRRRIQQNCIVMIFSGAYLCFVLWVGGDFQVYFYRFIIPILPLLFLLLSNALIRMYELLKFFCPDFSVSVCAIIVSGLIAVNFFAVQSPVIPFFSKSAERTPIVVENLSFLLRQPTALKDKIRRWFSAESFDIQPMDMVGRVLDKKLEPEASLATGQCGQIPFYIHNRRVVDMIGLMDDKVARQGMSLEYFKRRKIDYCVFFYSEADNYFIPLTLYPKLINSDFFRKNYKMEYVFRHRSIFPGRNLYSEKYMLLFKKNKLPVNIKTTPYNLRSSINLCLENGHYIDLKCNLNQLQRGQFARKGSTVSRKNFTSLSFIDGNVAFKEGAAELNKKYSAVSSTVNKPVYDASCQVWSHVKLSSFADYERIKMTVSAVNSQGLQTKVESAKSPANILCSGSPLDAWLPLICRVPTDTDWQVVVKVTAGGRPIYVDKPMLIRVIPWPESQFKKL